MPTHKDFKRLVRARMRKTGEAYSAARAQLLAKNPSPAPAALPPPARVDYATLAGMSDTSIKEKTGCTWERWVWALDRVHAHTWPHRDIAEYVYEKYKTSGWWAQMVTVGYERIKGLRAIGQRRDGGFEASKSKVFAAPVGKVYRAFRDSRTRARWLPGVKLEIRTATPNKSMRITWPDRTSVALGFVRKGKAKTQVWIQHTSLPDRNAVERVKGFWTGRLDALQAVVARERPTA